MSAAAPDVNVALAYAWAGIVAFAVFAYIVMDGFDLGIGMLFPLFRDPEDRARVMNSIAPIWDGNETWLVLGGGGLMAVFPLAYAVLLPALYTPVIAMLIGLIFRGVAFEFRWRTRRGRAYWDAGFFLGSALAGFMQGVSLGTILQGIHVVGRHYAGGWWDWLTPFSVLAGLSIMAGYLTLGAAWLLIKTDGPLQQRVFAIARPCAVALIVGMSAVSAATPWLQNGYYHRWFTWPYVLGTAQVPLVVLIVTIALFVALARRWERAPFLLTLTLFALSFIGLGISVFPYLVPESITILQAAAPARSQGFLLVGTAILIPIILGYMSYAYWVFRGKVATQGYYH
jgi:cytochrome d ubiquinol oxidase subunit II